MAHCISVARDFMKGRIIIITINGEIKNRLKENFHNRDFELRKIQFEMTVGKTKETAT